MKRTDDDLDLLAILADDEEVDREFSLLAKEALDEIVKRHQGEIVTINEADPYAFPQVMDGESRTTKELGGSRYKNCALDLQGALVSFTK